MPVSLSLRAGGRVAVSAAAPGARLYDLVRAAGWPLGSSCKGEGICARCGLRVVGGGELLSEESAQEVKIKVDNRLDPALVIACLRRVNAEDGALELTADYW